MRQFTTLFALLGSWTVVCGQREGCLNNLFDEVMACFTDQGLSLHVQPGQQDASRLMQETQAVDPAVQCKNKDAYKAAIGCSLTSLKMCLVDVNMGGAIPDVSKFREGMDVVCRRQDDFDNDCLQEKYRDILFCGEETMKTVYHGTEDNLSMNDVICISADVNYDCSNKYLQSCANATLEIYLEQLDKYQVPSACAARSPGRAGRQVHSFTSSNDNSRVSSAPLLTALVSLATVLLRSGFQ